MKHRNPTVDEHAMICFWPLPPQVQPAKREPLEFSTLALFACGLIGIVFATLAVLSIVTL